MRLSRAATHRRTRAPERCARARSRGRSRGQALVEFSFVVVPFVIIFFGTVEFALIMASFGTYNFAARDAARIGSILGRSDTTAAVDGKIVTDIRNHAKGLVMAVATEIDVYRAAPDGLCYNAVASAQPPATEVAVASAACIKNVYDINGNLQNPVASPVAIPPCAVAQPAPWPTCTRDDSLTNADYIGVRVKYNYTYLTGFIAAFGSTLSLSATSVQRIEPLEYTGFHGGLPRAVSVRAGALAALTAPGESSWLAQALADDHVGWLKPRSAQVLA